MKTYKEHYTTKLPLCLVDQYKIPHLLGIVLPRAAEKGDLYDICSRCHESMLHTKVDKSPPRLSIANGFAFVSIPDQIEYMDKDVNIERRSVDVEEDINDVLQDVLLPNQPYGYGFTFSGGEHKMVRGSYLFFRLDQSHVSSTVQLMNDSSMGPIIYCMCCKPFTPTQRDIVKRQISYRPLSLSSNILLVCFKVETSWI